MKKITSHCYWALALLICSPLLFSSCKKGSDSPEPEPENERITLVKKWAGKWAFQDLTNISPKIEYFNTSRNANEMIYGEKEFTIERARSLDTLTMLFEFVPSRPPEGELPNLRIYHFFKQYPNFTVDRLNLEITPSNDKKTKGTIVVKQIFGGPGVGDATNNPIGGSADIWRITFTIPR